MDELLVRHKKESKDLQNEIIRIKKSVQKSDKKRFKENQIIIANLEKELKERHQKEIEKIKCEEIKSEEIKSEEIKSDEVKPEEIEPEEIEPEEIEPEEIKENETNNLVDSSDMKNLYISKDLPKTSKRKKKKQDQEQKIANILRDYDANITGSQRTVELKAIKNKLTSMNMKLIEIPADGNCLYNAIGFQCIKNKLLSLSCDFGKSDETAKYLRKLAANEMISNSDSYSPFMDCEAINFTEYCKSITSTRIWGGHLEIKALSSALKRTIKILQANSDPIIIGDEVNSSDSPLLIIYHRLELGLGQHYNTCDHIDPNTVNGDTN